MSVPDRFTWRKNTENNKRHNEKTDKTNNIEKRGGGWGGAGVSFFLSYFRGYFLIWPIFSYLCRWQLDLGK